MNNDITLDSSNISSDDSFIKTFNIEINKLSDGILDESGLYHYLYYLIIYLVIPTQCSLERFAGMVYFLKYMEKDKQYLQLKILEHIILIIKFMLTILLKK